MKNYIKYIDQSIKNKKDELINLFDTKHSIISYHNNGLINYNRIISLLYDFSPSKLKYSRKFEITYNTNDYIFNISDVHVEIDFNLLGVNELNIFIEAYNHIKDYLIQKKEYIIIVCLNFENIKKELLNIFYTFLDNSKIRFILLTKQISFLNNNILNQCFIKRHNSKNIIINNTNNEDVIINSLISCIENNKSILEIRNACYDILIKNKDVNISLGKIIQYSINHNIINESNIIDFFNRYSNNIEMYNNNYRSIFHIERFIYLLINLNNNNNILYDRSFYKIN
tara:strand:- start:310 stop:1161 length:852 start_codon:yes stop_codon:yes gene_type:complete